MDYDNRIAHLDARRKLAQRRVDYKVAEAMWGGFIKCPTTGRIREVLPGDDKALCNCRTSNPRVPEERTAETGVHIARFCEQATVDEYLDQRERDREADRG